MGIPISDITLDDRPRERLDRLGAHALTDAELLALILRSGVRGASALDVAADLLATRGGLTAIAGTDLGTLAQQPALGTAKAAAIVAAFELGRRVERQGETSPSRIRGPEDIAMIGRRALTDTSREEVVVLVAGRTQNVLRVENLTVGTDSRCLLDPRDVLSVVLKHGGHGFALVHSHPSGDARPSAEDLAATQELRAAAEAVGVRFLDHVIVAGNRWSAVGERSTGVA